MAAWRHLQRSAAIVAALLPLTGAFADATVQYKPVVTLDPESREVSACGVRLEVLPPGASSPALTASLRQRRVDDDTLVEWCAQPATPDAAGGGGAVVLEVPGVATLQVVLAPANADAAAGADAVDGTNMAGNADAADGSTGATAAWGAELYTPPPPPPEACAAVSADAALLFQRLFVSGGTLRIDADLVRSSGLAATDADVDLPLQRPLPVALSRAYLNCAGDLFRPEDDT